MNILDDVSISPYKEMVAFETLWAIQGATQKTVSEKFVSYETTELPSSLLSKEIDLMIDGLREDITQYLQKKDDFSVMVHGMFQYPQKLRDAKYPLELFYYKGDISLVESKCISIVGARSCTEDGRKRARKLAYLLAEKSYTIVSGLASGIDTAALCGAIAGGGRVIGVIGTPIDEYYPKENKELQNAIATNFLLISQVPFYKYKVQAFQSKKNYFPERNKTMAALSQATVIVEASERSGTLTQARACFEQGRPLFILNSCFLNPKIKWPHTYIKRDNVYRVNQIEDILNVLGDSNA